MQKWHRRQSASTTVEGGTVDPIMPTDQEGIHRAALDSLEYGRPQCVAGAVDARLCSRFDLTLGAP